MSIWPNVVTKRKARSRLSRLTLAAAAPIALSACAQSIAPPLPDLTRTSADSLMTPAQQQKAIQDLSAKKSAEETEALKKIEGSH